MTTSKKAGKPQQPAARDDALRLAQEIEQTREQLGETVEQLAAKADVKARARAAAAQVPGRVQASAGLAWQKAAAQAGSVRPEQVRQALAKGASGIRQYRVPLAVAAGMLTAGYLMIRWSRHR